MGGVEISTQLDTRELVEQLEGAASKMTSAIASGLNKSARAARRASIKTMAEDIGRPASSFRDAVPLIRRASPNNLSATFTAKKKAIGVLPTGQFFPVRSALQGQFVGSTFRLSGGGSAHLSIAINPFISSSTFTRHIGEMVFGKRSGFWLGYFATAALTSGPCF